MYHQDLSDELILKGFRNGNALIIRKYFYGYCQAGYGIFDQRYQLSKKRIWTLCRWQTRTRIQCAQTSCALRRLLSLPESPRQRRDRGTALRPLRIGKQRPRCPNTRSSHPQREERQGGEVVSPSHPPQGRVSSTSMLALRLRLALRLAYKNLFLFLCHKDFNNFAITNNKYVVI